MYYKTLCRLYIPDLTRCDRLFDAYDYKWWGISESEVHLGVPTDKVMPYINELNRIGGETWKYWTE